MKVAYDTSASRQTFLRGAYDAESEALVCALCGGSISRKLAENEEARVVMCTTCSLAYLAPRLTKEGYKRFYREYFQDSRRSLRTLDDAVRRLLRKGAYENKKPIVEAFHGAIRTDDRGLDIGSGWGTLAKALEDTLDCSVEVVEPSLLAARVAHEYYGLTAHAEDGETFMRDAELKERYDFVLLVHVLEHVLDPNVFLKRAGQILKPGGKLLLALPDLSRPDEPSDRFFHIEHCYYYTPKTLSLMLGKHGFRVHSIVQDAHDMKVIAGYYADVPLSSIAFANDEYRIVHSRIARIDARYGLLRALKRTARLFFPRSVFLRIHHAAVRVLRESGIIT